MPWMMDGAEHVVEVSFSYPYLANAMKRTEDNRKMGGLLVLGWSAGRAVQLHAKGPSIPPDALHTALPNFLC
jgi:hypothetical protein